MLKDNIEARLTMQNGNGKMLFLTCLSFAGFIICWALTQTLAHILGDAGRFISLLAFLVIYVGISGIALPLYLSPRLGFRPHAPASRGRMIAGIAALLLGLVIGVFFSDALPILSKHPPTIEGVVKYLLLFAPMVLGICLQSFFLVPRTVETISNGSVGAIVMAVAITASSVGLGFWADQCFVSTDLALTMLFLGVPFGLGAVLTRSLYLTYLFYLPTILVNTLSEGKYYAFPWSALIIGFAFSCLMVIANYYLIARAADPERQAA